MRLIGRLTLAIGLFAILTSAEAGGLDSISRDLKGLEGTWKVVKFQRNEQDLDTTGMTWIIQKDMIVIRSRAPRQLLGVAKTPYRLNITRLAGIDLMPTYPPNQGKPSGNLRPGRQYVTLCFSVARSNRPTEFTARQSNCELIVLERQRSRALPHSHLSSGTRGIWHQTFGAFPWARLKPIRHSTMRSMFSSTAGIWRLSFSIPVTPDQPFVSKPAFLKWSMARKIHER